MKLWALILMFVAVLGIAALIYFPVIAECGEVGGVVVRNAFNWPVCIESTSP